MLVCYGQLMCTKNTVNFHGAVTFTQGHWHKMLMGLVHTTHIVSKFENTESTSCKVVGCHGLPLSCYTVLLLLRPVGSLGNIGHPRRTSILQGSALILLGQARTQAACFQLGVLPCQSLVLMF